MTGKKSIAGQPRAKQKKQTAPSRPVDHAMRDERPEKVVMRNFWGDVAVVADPLARQLNVPLYLTLCGAEGRDIEILIERGIITTSETGAISTESLGRVIAVEKNIEASLALNKRFPGLTIREMSFEDLLQGPSPTRFPVRDHEKYCRALVVNLDLDETLHAKKIGAEIEFPVINWIRKLSQIHATRPRIDWYLCLTLHGEIIWTTEVCNLIQNFLAENFREDEIFTSSAREFLGSELVNAILDVTPIPFTKLSTKLQQMVLMLFVPKKISSLVNADGWMVSTEKNVRYGGSHGRAPMVSWVIKFVGDPKASGRPRQLYRDSLATILRSPIWIDGSGSIK